jgi:hypothetical protein
MTNNLIRLWDKDFNLLWSSETGTQEEFGALITARTARNRTIDFDHGSRLAERIEYQDNGAATFHDYQSYLSKIMAWSNPFAEPKYQGPWALPPDPFIPEAWEDVIPDEWRHVGVPKVDNVVAVTVGTDDGARCFRLCDLWRQLRQWRS